MHKCQQYLLLDTLAKDGDVYLSEGYLDNQKKTQSFPGDRILRCVGWEDEVLNKSAEEKVKEYYQLQDKIKEAEVKHQQSDALNLKYQLADVRKQIHTTSVVERNKQLVKVIANSAQQYPDSTIFVIAGRDHFLTDPALLVSLKQYSHIIYCPKHDLSAQELQEMRLKDV